MNKREILLVTALKLFVENGFHGTATSKIAMEAKVATGTLFNYFSTKEELIVVLYHSVIKDMDNFILERMESHSVSKDAFRSLFKATLLWSLENPIHFQYLQQFLPQKVKHRLLKLCFLLLFSHWLLHHFQKYLQIQQKHWS